MSIFNRLFRRSEAVAPNPSETISSLPWDTLSRTNQEHILHLFANILHEQLMRSVCREIYCLDESFYATNIPYKLLIETIKRVTPRPFVVMPYEKYAVLCFVQNLERVTSIMAPSQYIAKSAVKSAIEKNESCAITHDSFKEIDTFCVGGCGHVFSIAASTQTSCPTCREAVAWTIVKSSDL